MATLKENFSDGDVLSAGITSDTDALNGITNQINDNTNTNIPARLKYVGSDTAGTVVNSIDETTIATVTIPANTVSTGIIAHASVGTRGTAGEGTFKLKIGATGSESLRVTGVIPVSGSTGNYDCRPLLYYENDQTWSADVTVLVTGQNGAKAATTSCDCFQLIITGY